MINFRLFQATIDKIKINAFLWGFCIFLLSQPYFVWKIEKLQLIMFLPVIFIGFFYLKRINNRDFLILLLFCLIRIFIASGSNLFGYINSMFFLIFFITKDRIVILSFNYFKNIFVVSLFLSLIVYVLVLFLTIPISFNIIKPLNTLKDYDYAQYPFLVSDGILSFKSLHFRFHGMFDEPGVIGTIATLLLLIDRFNLKSKQNKILFVSGLFSLSFYFIIGSIFYILFFTKNKLKILIAIAIIIFYIVTVNNSSISFFVWNRFAIKDNTLVGDNRSSIQLDYEFTKLFNNYDYIWGKGSDFTKKNNLMGTSSYKSLFINYGVVFIIVLLIAFYLFAYSNIKDKKLLSIYMFIFLGIIYQRPGMLYFPGSFFLLIASVIVIKNGIAEEITQLKRNSHPQNT